VGARRTADERGRAVARPRGALARARGLAEAARLVGANGHDLDATLDALAAQARALLGADHAGVYLAVPNTDAFVRRRPSRLAAPGAAFAEVGAAVEPDALVRAAIAARWPVFTSDYQMDPRVAPAWRVGHPTIVAGLAAPLFAADELVGYLFACWTRRHRASAADLELAEALGRHAAVAIRTARLLDDARRARVEAEARLRRLEAVQRVSGAVEAAGDLDALLSALLAEAITLVGADRGMVALVDPDRGVVRGRVGLNLPAGLVEATVRRIYPAPDPDEDAYALVVRAGQQVVLPHDHPTWHRPTAERFGLGPRRSVLTPLLTPIRHAGAVIGVLSAIWSGEAAPGEEDLAALRLIAEQAGGAVARARLLEAAERVRGELEAVLDAAADTVLVFAPDGRLLRANGPGRVGTARLLGGGVPVTAAALRAAAAPRRPDGSVPVVALLQRALAGRRVVEELVWRGSDGVERRLHVVAVPVWDGAGQVWAAVIVAHDVTALHGAIAARERLDGAVKTARRVAHELNNQLAPVRGYGELLAQSLEGEPRDLAARVVRGAEAAAATIARLQRIVRFEETVSAGQPMLDLAASTDPRPPPQPDPDAAI
jgi:GAF domain-containing protein